MISCVIPTKDRYDSLFACLLSVVMQTKKPREIIIYDDSVKKKNFMRRENFRHLKSFGVPIDVKETPNIGQTAIHELSQNDAHYPLIWRIDDDCVASQNVLETLAGAFTPDVGAVGGLIHVPGRTPSTFHRFQKIEQTDSHVQMFRHQNPEPFQVDHLHCSFLYRKGIVPFPHRILHQCGMCEETIFSHEIARQGYRLMVMPESVTYHLQSARQGMRSYTRADLEHNKAVLERKKELWAFIPPGSKVIVDAHGIGDSIVLEAALPEIVEKDRKTIIFTNNIEAYKIEPVAVEDVHFLRVEDANIFFSGYFPEDVYGFMARREWTRSMQEAYVELYGRKEK